MRRITQKSFYLILAGLVLAAVLLGGCSRGLHNGSQTGGSQPQIVQPSSADPVESEYNNLDQDLQTLDSQLKTPELPADNP